MQQDDTEIRAEFMNALHGKAKVWRVWKRECAEEREARYRSFLAEELRRGEPARQRNDDQQLLMCLKPIPLERPHE